MKLIFQPCLILVIWLFFVDNENEGDLAVEGVDFQSFGRRTRIIGRGEDIIEEEEDSDY